MREATMVLALWAAVIACGCKKQPQPDGVEPLLLELSADGHVRADGRAVSLDGLGAYISEIKRGARGAVEQTGHGFSAWNLDVVVRVDPNAYWQQVQWMLAVCIEEKLNRTWFEQPGERRVKVFQHIDAAVEWLPGYPRERALCVTIDIEHENGGAVRYRCGERTARSVNAVDAWVADALRAERRGTFVIRVGEIRAPLTVAFRHVFAVMEVLADSELEKIWIYGSSIAPPAVRANSVLSVPESRWTPPAGRGIRAVPYHPDLGLMDYEDEEDEEDEEESIEEPEVGAPPAER